MEHLGIIFQFIPTKENPIFLHIANVHIASNPYGNIGMRSSRQFDAIDCRTASLTWQDSEDGDPPQSIASPEASPGSSYLVSRLTVGSPNIHMQFAAICRGYKKNGGFRKNWGSSKSENGCSVRISIDDMEFHHDSGHEKDRSSGDPTWQLEILDEWKFRAGD